MSNVTQRNVEDHRPRIAITLGDVAGIGPELAVRAWSDPRLHEMCRPLIIGNAEVLRREIQKVRSLEPEGGNVLEGRLSDREKDGKEGVQEILSVTEPLTPNPSPRESEGSAQLLCLEGSSVAVADLEPGRVHA